MDDATFNTLKSRLEQSRRSLVASPARSQIEQQLLDLHEAVRLLLADLKP